MTLLEHALNVVERGWAVFPCYPKSKAPATRSGLKDATKDPEQVRQWWGKNPAYNPAINLGMSNLTVLDIDGGLADDKIATKVCDALPATLTVRTGRRPEWGVQLYYEGLTNNRPYELTIAGVKISGEVRSAGYYVLAPGAIHDKSRERYYVGRDLGLVPIPPVVLELSQRRLPKPTGESEEKIPPSSRHYYLNSRAAGLVNEGMYGEGLVQALRWFYENRCERDAAKDAKVRDGELEGIARWAERNITPGLYKDDLQLVTRLAVEDPKWRAAWEGDLSAFGGVDPLAQAYDYLAAPLLAQLPHKRAIRIGQASPLNRRYGSKT